MADVEITTEYLHLSFRVIEPTVSAGSTSVHVTGETPAMEMEVGSPVVTISELSSTPLQVWWTSERLFLKATGESTSVTTSYPTGSSSQKDVRVVGRHAEMSFSQPETTVQADCTVEADIYGNFLSTSFSMSVVEPSVKTVESSNVSLTIDPVSFTFSMPDVTTRIASAGSTQFTIENPSSIERSETFLATVPFAEGFTSDLSSTVVDGKDTAWKTLQTWQDGSIKLAQAQVYDTISAGSTTTHTIAAGTAESSGFSQHAWVSERWADFDVQTSAFDMFDTRYDCSMQTDGTEEELSSTSLVRTKRWRGYHTASSGGVSKGDFLSQTVYVTEYKDCPFLDVTVCVGNDYRGSDNPGASTDKNDYPLGHVRLNWLASFLGTDDASSYEVFPVFQDARDVKASPEYDGWFDLYHDQNKPNAANGGGLDFHYVMDGQNVVWKFVVVLFGSAATSAERRTYTNQAKEKAQQPIFPLATLSSWQSTRALGLMGGIVAGKSASKARSEYEAWNATITGTGSQGGTFGSWEDTKLTDQPGTPRNDYTSEHAIWGIQNNEMRSVRVLQGLSMQQGFRPYHLWDLASGEVAGEVDMYMFGGVQSLYADWFRLNPNGQSLGRKDIYYYQNEPSTQYSEYRAGIPDRLPNPHGWYPYDEQHFSMSYVFDYHQFTGDEWAKEEIRYMGSCLPYLLPRIVYNNDPSYNWPMSWLAAARAEGWCAIAGIQAYLTLQEDWALEWLRNRSTEQWDKIGMVYPPNAADYRHTAEAVFQNIGGYKNRILPGVGDTKDLFFMPWQHAPLLFACCAYTRLIETRPIITETARRCVQAVDYAWVEDYPADPSHVSDPYYITDGIRYYCMATEYDGGSQTEIAANYYDWNTGSSPDKNHYNPMFGESPLGGSQLFLVAPLFFASEEFEGESWATTALTRAETWSLGEKQDEKWLAVVYPENI